MLLLCTGVAIASRRDWTGSAACGSCHPKELAAWQATPHASTRGRFEGRPQPMCLGCHGTGDAPAGAAIAVEVGCEACHGAGAAYGEDDIMRDRPVALALGMTDLSGPKQRVALCNTCHARRTTSTPFDPTVNPHPVTK
jgi:Cytochrome c554 and c-prime